MLNKVMLIGHLGKDPEIRATQSGTSVVTFTMATTERWKDKDGQMQEITEWHRVVAWRKLAEICGNYLHKGSKVYIEGKLQTRKWQDQNGNDKYTTEIVANEMKMLDSKGSAEGGYSGGSSMGGGSQESFYAEPPAGMMGGGGRDDVPF
ncbi:MAG: single-stranded DNA-binding protein [Proteobacteria bacterium]|jgi:single-strand DNA-binding protein|nr:single-stranded DNA-binding protein [Desulfocapsa sp.]MBU3943938.1 single-stranded DNA-binding protein [Pseudomonadota bacterium]MCG2742902.1 single-stranded DNA-binding protein [Desulfobacteraceae bacterium]MDO8946507.1 single-stranded DNA-binding protein [Desulfocapsaceae bacterium]MBU3983765.1 single-stranded DNA-binding protein [Pseudomonadota bacterium]